MQNKKFLIVGQGIAGSVLALQLYKLRIPFTVIDDTSLSMSSRVAAGIWNPVVFRRMTLSWRAQELVPAMHKFFLDAQDILQTEFFYPCRMMKFFTAKEEADIWKKKSTEMKDFIDDNIYPASDFSVKGIVPPAYGFSFVKESGNLDTVKFIDTLKEVLKIDDQLIEEEFDYAALKNTGEAYEYNGELYNGIIFCEGWMKKVNPWFGNVPMKPAKGEVITIQCPELKLKHIVNKNFFILPLGDDQYKCGATYAWDVLNDEITIERQNELEEKLKKLLRLPYEIMEREAGVRPATTDRRPLLGEHPKHKGLFIFNGFGTKAVLQTPFFAERMIKFILENEPLPEETNISRYNLK